MRARVSWALLPLLCAPGCAQTSAAANDEPAAGVCAPEISTTRTGYPELRQLWTDGQHQLAFGDALARVSGDAASFYDAVVGDALLGARSLDEVWILDGDELLLFDGATTKATKSGLDAPLLAVGADATWLLASIDCTPDACPPTLWRWDGAAWIEQPGPELDDASALAIGPDGELWIAAAQGRFARGLGDAWIIEELDDPSLAPTALVVDEIGQVWAAGGNGAIELANRDVDGQWSRRSLDFGYTNYVRLIPRGAEVLLFARRGSDAFGLYRWTQAKSPALLVDDGYFDALGIHEVRDVAGAEEQLWLLAEGPSIHRFDPLAPPFDPTPILELSSADPSGGAALGVDVAFAFEDATLLRWDGERWAARLTIPTTGYYPPRIEAVHPTSADEGWMVVDLGHSLGEQIWRWDGQQASPRPSQPPADVDLQRLWGTGPEWMWMTGVRDSRARVWRFDGGAWLEVLGEDDQRWEIKAITGDEQRVFVVTADGLLLEWFEDAWTRLGEPLPVAPSDAQLARIGDELLVRYDWVEGIANPSPKHGFLRWTGESWALANPDLPNASLLADDGHGHGWLYTDDHELYRHTGEGPSDQGWELVASLPGAAPTMLLATPDGTLVCDSRDTTVIPTNCE